MILKITQNDNFIDKINIPTKEFIKDIDYDNFLANPKSASFTLNL